MDLIEALGKYACCGIVGNQDFIYGKGQIVDGKVNIVEFQRSRIAMKDVWLDDEKIALCIILRSIIKLNAAAAVRTKHHFIIFMGMHRRGVE